MTAPTFLRPRGYARWCRYRTASAGERITTACGAGIAQGEPLELAEDAPLPDRCAACEATTLAERRRTGALHDLAGRRAELEPAGHAIDADDAPGPDSAAIRAALDTEHEDLLGESAFDRAALEAKLRGVTAAAAEARR